MKSVTRSERNIAHRLIEEFMLAANECVASYLEGKGSLRVSIHEKPDPKRVYDFETIAAKFGYSLGVGPLPIQRMPSKTDKRSHYGTDLRPRAIIDALDLLRPIYAETSVFGHFGRELPQFTWERTDRAADLAAAAGLA